MKKDMQQERIWAVQRFFAGEKPQSICASLGHARSWLYKWIERFVSDDPLWYQGKSRQPLHNAQRTPAEIEEIIKMVRLSLYNQGLFCGAQAIRWEMQELGIQPSPSLRTINRILRRHDLTNRRTGRYQPKGKSYPVLPADLPNQTHQADLVGPCYLKGKGPIRFYSLNAVDITTGRCALQPAFSCSGQNVIDGFWAIWKRMGIPKHIQVDNEMSFFGSPTHPRGMGPLIRLCLHHHIEPWFIPPAEPWRNGVVEKFNDHYEQKFLNKVTIHSQAELLHASLNFEYKHNSRYRYSKLGGKTPLQTLAALNKKNCVFPSRSRLLATH